MNSSFVFQTNPAQNQMDRKPRSSVQDRKSRQNSKEGHMNPLKIKTSFLRQSLTLNSSDQNLTLNMQNPSSLSRNHTHVQVNLALQSNQKDDFMMRKIAERFSGTVSPHNETVVQPLGTLLQSQKQREIIRLSGRKNEHLGLSQIQKSNLPLEKQNSWQQNLALSGIYQSGINQKIEASGILPYTDKGVRSSQESTALQSVASDNSLSDFINVLNQQSTKSVPSCIIKEQLQLILKRLAKNQCDIEALKRDKNLDVHMESVWKKFSSFQGKLDSNERKLHKFDEKQVKWIQGIEELRKEVLNVNQTKITSLREEIKGLQSKIISVQLGLTQKRGGLKLSLNNSMSQTPLSQETQTIMNDLSKNIKKEMDYQFQKLNNHLQVQFQIKLASLKKEITSDRVIEQIQEDDDSKIQLNSGKCSISTKKSHEFIALVYKQVLKVSSKSTSRAKTPQQGIYKESDRSKLLANVFNTNLNSSTNSLSSGNPRRLPYSSSLPVSPHEQPNKNPISETCLSSFSKPSSSPQIEINQVEYFVDPEGYLLDKEQFYIVDGNGNQIRLDDRMLQVLKRNNVLSSIFDPQGHKSNFSS